MLLQHSKDLGLRVRTHVADFVEEQTPAVGLFEATHALSVGARKRALLVPEQLGFQQVFLKGGAVYPDKVSTGPSRVVVNRTRDQLFTRAGFARIKTVCCSGRPCERY